LLMERTQTFDMSNYGAGIYILELKKENKIQKVKIIRY